MEKRFEAGLMAISMFLCASCSTGMYDSLSRTTADPYTEKPTVRSFNIESTILISWTKDDAADEYILERSVDALSVSYTTIYSGNKLSYTDTTLEAGNRYLYRLSKRRGEKYFTASDAVLGVCSLVCADEYEPNDVKSKAVSLVADHIANLFYYRSYSGLILSDSDWYCVTILPCRKAEIVITDSDPPSGGTDTHFKVYINGVGNQSVYNKQEFEIENTKNSTETYYFMVYPDEDKFLASSYAGGNIYSYTVSYESMVPL